MANKLFMKCELEDPQHETDFIFSESKNPLEKFISLGKNVKIYEGAQVKLTFFKSQHHKLADEIKVEVENAGIEYLIGYIKDVEVKYLMPFHINIKDKNNKDVPFDKSFLEANIHRINPNVDEGASGVTISIYLKFDNICLR